MSSSAHCHSVCIANPGRILLLLWGEVKNAVKIRDRLETKTRFMVSRGWGKGEVQVLIWAQGLLGMKKKVELDSGDG
jgi:hypothetical protein